jgi:hypothetical protein
VNAAKSQPTCASAPEPIYPAPAIEARLLALLLVDVDARAVARNLDVDDFCDFRNRAIFTAVRELEATQAEIGPVEVLDAIAMLDLESGRCQREHVTSVYVGALFDRLQTYPRDEAACMEAVRADMRQLRSIAVARVL